MDVAGSISLECPAPKEWLKITPTVELSAHNRPAIEANWEGGIGPRPTSAPEANLHVAGDREFLVQWIREHVLSLDGMKVPGAALLRVQPQCGSPDYVFQTLDDLPDKSLRCACGKHWVVKYADD